MLLKELNSPLVKTRKSKEKAEEKEWYRIPIHASKPAAVLSKIYLTGNHQTQKRSLQFFLEGEKELHSTRLTLGFGVFFSHFDLLVHSWDWFV